MTYQLCVVIAAPIEFKTVAKLLHDPQQTVLAGLTVTHGRFGPGEITLLQSQIGAPGFADRLQHLVAASRFQALLVMGLAGALEPTLRTGEVVIYDACLDARGAKKHLPDFFSPNREISPPRDDFASIACNATLGKQLFEAVRQCGLRSRYGTGALVEEVIIEARAKAALHQQTHATAVDMETWLVCQALAAVNDLPCAALRVVLDEANDDLPDFNAALSATGQMRLWPTLRVLVARPRASGRFLRSLRPALRSLERASQAVFTCLTSR